MLSAPDTLPAHIDRSHVYDFDMFTDPAYLQDPHTRIMQIIATAPPVFWTPRNSGHWMIIGHEAAFNASRDWESFSSEVIPQEMIQAMIAAMPPGTPHIPQGVPINMDPPLHGKFRTPLNTMFSPKAMLAMKNDIRALAGDFIDSVKGQGRCEFMAAIAEPLPVQVFLKMFGLPVERQVEYRALVNQFISSPMTDMAENVRMLRGVCDVMHETIMERRERPQNDIISAMWQTRIDGREMSLDDIENYCVVLFLAGLDTVMNAMGHGVRHLAMHPDLQATLRANPALIVNAAEEFLRRYTFTVPTRIVARDIEFAGGHHEKGRSRLSLPARRRPRPGGIPRSGCVRHVAREQGAYRIRRRSPSLSRLAPGAHRAADAVRGVARSSAPIPARSVPSHPIPWRSCHRPSDPAPDLGPLTPTNCHV
jgi:cytochrome P450